MLHRTDNTGCSPIILARQERSHPQTRLLSILLTAAL
jgi:hypothetical protein